MRILTETVSHNGNEVTSGVSVTGREVTMVGETMEHASVCGSGVIFYYQPKPMPLDS